MATHDISGTIGSLTGVVITAGGLSAVTAAGAYTIADVTDGLVTVVPMFAGYIFSPPSYTFILGGDVTGIDFTATAESYPWITTNFQLRVSSTTFKPHAQIGRNVELEQGEDVWIERGELVDFTLADYYVGSKQIVSASFTVLYRKTVTPETGYSTLEAVLNARTAGSTLEYSVDGGSTWVACKVTRPLRKKLDNKNVGYTFNIELVSLGIVANPWKTS